LQEDDGRNKGLLVQNSLLMDSCLLLFTFF